MHSLCYASCSIFDAMYFVLILLSIYCQGHKCRYKRRQEEETYKKGGITNRECSKLKVRRSFCPIVSSTSGGQAPATQALVKRLATLLSEKLDIPRPITTSWLRNRLSMAITRSCIMCLRGARSRSRCTCIELSR